MIRQRLAVSLGVAAATAAVLSAGVFTERGSQPPLNHELLEPSNCASCHADYDDNNHLEPWNTWAGSMMANASRDPLFWAALDVANNDVPGIGEYCFRCHSSAGWFGERVNPDTSVMPPATGNADGCLEDNGSALIGKIDEPGNDFTGVSCHLCHRMQVNDNPPPGEETYYLENGDFWIDDGNCPDGGSGPCRRGPYNYPPNPAAPHEWAYSAYHFYDNEICGNCHNVTSPLLNLVDETGVDQGVGFPIERTFKEWQQSDFSDRQSGSFANCSSCHMPDATADPAYASSRGNPDRTGDLPIHQFAGGNTWIPQVFKGEYPGLDRNAELDATTAWALDLLQNRSALVEVSADATVAGGGSITAEVKITNLSGHKLPTGYGEGRRMWLGLEARDGLDQPIWESGAWDGGTGELTYDSQVKIYEVQQGIWNYNGTGSCDVESDATGKHLFHFVRNNCIALDNRIPPLGFRPETSPGVPDIETVPVNYSYPETSPGSGVLVNWDTTEYSIPVPPGTPTPITVEATLYYQTASKEYVEFLRDQAVENSSPDDCLERNVELQPGMSRGEYLYALWENPAYGRSPPVDMGVASAEVEVTTVDEIFSDDFESGDTSVWDSSVP